MYKYSKCKRNVYFDVKYNCYQKIISNNCNIPFIQMRLKVKNEISLINL